MNASRRRFLRDASFAGGVFAMAPTLALPSPSAVLALGGPVLSFHLDQPYLDLTGEARIYRPPAGARGGAPIEASSDAELSRYYGFI